MENTPDTFRVCFVPARNGSDVICRLPSGKVAFPSRYYWNQPPPRPYEVWIVRPCGEIARPAVSGAASVGYVKPIQRLAEAPFRDTRAGRLGNSVLLRLGRSLARLVNLWQRPRAAMRRHAQSHADGHGG
jgi:hypothetical protein